LIFVLRLANAFPIFIPIVEWKGLFALHYFTKEIIDLKSEWEEIEASPNMQQKKKEIQEKLIKI